MAAAELVRAALGGSEVNFLLAENLAVGSEQVGGVENLAALEDGMGPADDVNTCFLGQAHEERFVLRSHAGPVGGPPVPAQAR